MNRVEPNIEYKEPSANQTTTPGRILALDPGTAHTGIAISDEHQIVARRLLTLPRTNWKIFVQTIKQLCRDFDARAVVVGLPLMLDGSTGEGVDDARRIARNLRLSLSLPTYLQDERLTSQAAVQELRAEKLSAAEIAQAIHSQSAAIILRDFLELPEQHRYRIETLEQSSARQV